ncbi:hypothetical protein KAR28_04265 [Candidatus Parcubacteria bacterium]|nr:hypothetical protein [Candidatus Parcubacteria bacterium]
MAVSKKVAPFFLGTIENGELKIDKLERFKQYLTKMQWKNKPTRIKIAVSKYKPTRSLRQNNYYWLCLTCIGNDVGEDPENLHTTFQHMFLKDSSKKFPIIRSTTSLNSTEFTEYIEKISRKMAEFGIRLPYPDEAFID